LFAMTHAPQSGYVLPDSRDRVCRCRQPSLMDLSQSDRMTHAPRKPRKPGFARCHLPRLCH
jgi:hypothetical protein